MLLTVESARTTRGQPGLSSFVERYTDGYGRQGQPDSLLGKSWYMLWLSIFLHWVSILEPSILLIHENVLFLIKTIIFAVSIYYELRYFHQLRDF